MIAPLSMKGMDASFDGIVYFAHASFPYSGPICVMLRFLVDFFNVIHGVTPLW